MKKQNITLVLLILLSQSLPAQTLLYVSNGCAVNDAEMGHKHYVFDPSDEAQGIIRTIMDAYNLDPNFVIKSGDVENAVATFENGQRYIVYNTTYVERIKRSGGSDWPAFYVFAHEIGHHLNNHSFNLNPDLEEDRKKSKEQELKADLFAGGMLFRLGATLDQAQVGIGNDFKESGSRTHPPRRARLEAIASGWKKEYDRSGGVQPKAITITSEASKTPQNYVEHALGATMVYVAGGTFDMGSTDWDGSEEPVHSVTLSDYYISETEVTQAQWRTVMGSDPPGLEIQDCDDCPVAGVSWNDILDFLQKLNARNRGTRYRLPTEAEWEFAARGGTLSQGYEYAGGDSDDAFWHGGNSGRKPRPVKSKKANELGLYDMSGNVAEWCSDWYGTYSAEAQINPIGQPFGGERVIRGGGWDSNYIVSSCRVTSRLKSTPDTRYNGNGFRFAKTP